MSSRPPVCRASRPSQTRTASAGLIRTGCLLEKGLSNTFTPTAPKRHPASGSHIAHQTQYGGSCLNLSIVGVESCALRGSDIQSVSPLTVDVTTAPRPRQRAIGGQSTCGHEAMTSHRHLATHFFVGHQPTLAATSLTYGPHCLSHRGWAPATCQAMVAV